MVSQQQLQAQQQALRQVRSRLTLQQQQQALRQGISQQQFQRREEQRIREQVQSKITKELRSQASSIDAVLKNVTSIEQFNELIQQVPPELRQFVRTNETALRADLGNRIRQVENTINQRQKEIEDFRVSIRDARADKNFSRAENLDARLRGKEEEISFLQGNALPQLQQGLLLPIDQVLSIGRKIGISEKEKRIALEEQFSKLGQKLTGGREELSRIIRTQQVTQVQAVKLGLIPEQAQVPSRIDTREKEVITGLAPEKQFSNIFGFSTEPTDFEKLTGLDFSKLGRPDIGVKKGFIERVKEKISEKVRIEPIDTRSIGIGFPALVTLETGSIFEKPSGLTINIKPEIEFAEKIVSFPTRKISEKKRREEEELAKFGRRDFFIRGVKIDTSRLTDKQIQLLLKEEKVIVKETPLTEEEIKGLTFGGGLNILEKRKIVDAELKLENLAKEEFNKLKPKSNEKINKKFEEIQERVNKKELSVEKGNLELKNFTDKINEENNKIVGKIIDKESDKLSSEINKEITDANKSNLIKRELALFGITIATGAVLGFGAAISPIISGGVVAFGIIESRKLVLPTFEAIKTKDIQTLGATGIQIAGFTIGGGIGAKFGAKFIESTKIRPAIDRAQVETIIKAQNLDVLKRFKFPKEFQLEMKTLLDKGFSIRVIETKLKAVRIADNKFLPDIRGRFIEILTRDGRIIETISIGNVIAKTPKKTFSRDIISESVGKVTGEKSFISTRTIVGKFKGDKFISLQELVTLQETQITGRERLTKTEEQIRADTTTFLVEKLTKKQLKDKKIFQEKGFEFKNIFETNKDLIGGNILKQSKIARQQLSSFLKQQKKKGRKISETETVSIEKVKGLDITRDIRIKTDVIEGVVIKKNLGEILTGFKTSESKVQSFTVNVPDVKIKKVTRKVPRDTLKEVFGAGTEVKKFKFKDLFKTKEGKEIINQQKQINKNINKLIETGTPEIVTKQVAKEIVKAEVRPRIIFGRIPRLGIGEGFGDLGVISSRLGSTTITGTKEEAKLRKKIKPETIDITKIVQGLGQTPLEITSFAQPQGQLQKQLQQLETSFAGVGLAQPIITTPNIKIDIPILFDFPQKKKIKKLLPSKLDIGWDVFVKSKGKQVKVTKNPVIRSMAQDIGSFLVDNTLSAEFSLRESRKQPKQPKIQVPRNYWGTNKNKFRQFRIKQGVQIPLKNTFIERKTNRLDSFGEINRITSQRLIKQQRQKKINLNKISKNLNKIFGV